MRNIFLGFFALIFGFTNAQNLNKASLDSLFTYLNDENLGSGAVSILQDGKEIYANAFGWKSINPNQKNDTETKFRIGSISKTYTATLFLKLVEEGKISLDTKLDQFYPKVSNASQINMRDLLQHRSGIFNITNEKDYLEWNTKTMSKDQLLTKIYQHPSNFEPNSQFEYSNSNYILLTFIIEDLTKKSFEAALDHYILKPLNLQNTKVGTQINLQNNEAESFNYQNNELRKQPETNMSIPLGAGSVVANAKDVNLFFYALFTGKIINSESLKEMTKIRDSFGLGLVEMPYNDKKGFGHTGGIDGFSSVSFVLDNVYYTVLQNSDEVSTNSILLNLLAANHGLALDYPTKQIAVGVDLETLKTYVGEYTSTDIPLGIKIYLDNDILMAQATGQSAFPLTAITVNEFEFLPAKLKMIFEPNNQMKLLQSGRIFNYSK